jgi:hypothetical protein
MRKTTRDGQVRCTIHQFPKRFGLAKPLWVAVIWQDGLVHDAFESTVSEQQVWCDVLKKWPNAVLVPEGWRPWRSEVA